MNIIHLIGNLGSDPKSVKNGEIAQVSLATSEKYTKKGASEPTVETTWHTIFFYGKAAEIILKYAKKGKKLQVTGTLKTNKYTNAAGVEMTGFLIRAENFEFLDKAEGSEKYEAVEESAPAQAPTTSKATRPATATTEAVKPVAKTVAPSKKPLAATVGEPSHTDEDLSFDDSDPTENDDLPF